MVNVRRAGARGALRASITNSPIHAIHQLRASNRGFTMIELLVVLSLIVILATMGMTQYRTSVIHAREAVLKEDLFRMRDAIDQYYADKNQYPSDARRAGQRRLHAEGARGSLHEEQGQLADRARAPDPNNPTAEPASTTSRAARTGPRSTAPSTPSGERVAPDRQSTETIADGERSSRPTVSRSA